MYKIIHRFENKFYIVWLQCYHLCFAIIYCDYVKSCKCMQVNSIGKPNPHWQFVSIPTFLCFIYPVFRTSLDINLFCVVSRNSIFFLRSFYLPISFEFYTGFNLIDGNTWGTSQLAISRSSRTVFELVEGGPLTSSGNSTLLVYGPWPFSEIP